MLAKHAMKSLKLRNVLVFAWLALWNVTMDMSYLSYTQRGLDEVIKLISIDI